MGSHHNFGAAGKAPTGAVFKVGRRQESQQKLVQLGTYWRIDSWICECRSKPKHMMVSILARCRTVGASLGAAVDVILVREWQSSSHVAMPRRNVVAVHAPRVHGMGVKDGVFKHR